MRKRKLGAIKYAFVCSMIASFSVVAVAGLFFGFHLGQWSEWQGGLVGITGSIAGVAGALFGAFTAQDHPGREKHR
jgi:H+/Cl- antiporter ClcA